MKKGPWQVTSTKQVYRDEFVELKVDQVVRPDGDKGKYATVNLKAGVAILAVDAAGEVYLTKQYRYAINAESVEVVSGGIDDDEDPLAAAKKELKEEIGIEAKEWRALGAINMDTSVIFCPLHLYVARGLTETGSEQEGTEDIRFFKVKLDDAIELVQKGEITHSASCCLILRVALEGCARS
jgi:8-oxo-dGTP pyrophosphatase MutT (NUDIX family)